MRAREDLVNVTLDKSGKYRILVQNWGSSNVRFGASVRVSLTLVRRGSGSTDEDQQQVDQQPEDEQEPEEPLVSDHVEDVESEIVSGGYCVNMPYGLETIGIKKIDVNNCAVLGNDAACNMNLLDGVTIDGYVEQGIKFCFPRRGAVYYIPNQLAGGVPVGRGFQPQPLPYYHSSNKTWINRVPGTGKLLLAASGHPPSGDDDRNIVKPQCKTLDAKLRPGQRAKNAIRSRIKIRDAADLSGRELGKLDAGMVVDVLEGPVRSDGYQWFKIRHGTITGWAAESGNCKYWLQQTSESVSQPTTRRFGEPIVVDGRCELEDAIEAANRDRVVGGCPGGRSGSDAIRLDTSVTLKRKLPAIESTIFIEGRGRFHVSGENRYQIFEVAANGNLRLNRVTLRNGKTDRQGGAIVNHGTLTVDNSTFRNNTADKDGGAISNSGTMTVSNSAFRNNTAGESGGAIRNKGSLYVSSNRFENNQAGEEGGAIRNKGSLNVSSNRFIGNRGEAGGAIDHDGDSIRLSGNTFSNNSPDNCRGEGVDCGDVPGLDPDELSIEIGGSLTGELEEGEEYHSIQLRLLERQSIALRMTATSGNLVPILSLWGRGGDLGLVVSFDNNESGLNAAELLQADLSAGLYEIRAGSARGSGSYLLEVFDSEGAPEETFAISYGATKRGHLSSIGLHKYTFTGSSDDVVDITMIRKGGQVAPKLSLRDDAGNELAKSGQSGRDRDALIESFILPKDGDYTIVASSYAGHGDYSLTLMSPDLDLKGAQNIKFGESKRGRLRSNSESNDFEFEAKTGDTIKIEVRAFGILIPTAELRHPQEGLLYSSERDTRGDGPISEINSRDITLPRDGKYKISIGRNEGVGIYRLKLNWVSFVDPSSGKAVQDLPAFWAIDQIKETADEMKDGVFTICDVAITAGAGSVGKAAATGAKVGAKILVKDILAGIAKHIAEKGLKKTIEWFGGHLIEFKTKEVLDSWQVELLTLIVGESLAQVGVEEEAADAARLFLEKVDQIAQLVNTILDSVPSGVCTGVQFVIEFEELKEDLEEQIEDLIDLTGLVGKCRIFADSQVPGLNWPGGQAVAKLYADTGLEIGGIFTPSENEKLYGVLGKFGSDFAIVGKYWSFLTSAITGLADSEFTALRDVYLVFVRDDLVVQKGNCSDLDKTSSLQYWRRPRQGEMFSPWVYKALDSGPPSKDCEIVARGSHKLYDNDNWHLSGGYQTLVTGDATEHTYRVTYTTMQTAYLSPIEVGISGWMDMSSPDNNVFKKGDLQSCVASKNSKWWAEHLPDWAGDQPDVSDDSTSDRPSETYAIEIGGSLTGELEEGRDFHSIRFRLNAPATISVRMTAASGNLVPSLKLWDNDGARRAQDENKQGANTAKMENLELAPGTYWIDALSVSGGGRYELEVLDVSPPAVDQPDEPDDSTTDPPSDRPDSDTDKSAVDEPDEPDDPTTDEPPDRPDSDPDSSAEDQPDEPGDPTTDEPSVPPLDSGKPSINVGDTRLGRLPAGNDYDEYQLRLLSDAAVTIRMSGCMRPGLSLHRDDGNKAVKDQKSRGGSNTAEFTNVDLGPGLYTISAWTVSGGGNYKLEVFSESRAKTSFAAPDPDKPTIGIGDMHHGSLPEGREYDTIQLCLLSPANDISILMSGVSGDLAPGLTLYDNVDNPEDRAESQFGVAELTNINLAPGVYHISAWSVSGGGDYTLAVN